MNVRSPKNEHHPGKAVRRVPLFAELREILTDAFEVAPEGAEYIIWKSEIRSGSQGPLGWKNANIRGRFSYFLQRAGIPDIAKPFQSMRSSRENEMVEEYPLKCVIDWVGHDVKVASQHYLNSDSKEYHLKAIFGGEKVAQKAAHTTTAKGCQELPNQGIQENEEAASPFVAVPCSFIQENALSAFPLLVGPEGFEPPTKGL